METTKVSKEFMKELERLQLLLNMKDNTNALDVGKEILEKKETFHLLYGFISSYKMYHQGVENLYQISAHIIDPDIPFFEEAPEPEYIAQVYDILYYNGVSTGVRVMQTDSIAVCVVSDFDESMALTEKDIEYLKERHGENVVTLHKVN